MRRPWLWAGSLTLLLFFYLSPAASAADPTLVLEAESLELAADGEYIRAEGNVVLTYGELTLRADAAVCRGKKVEATGAVSLMTPTAALRAARLSVDLASGAIDAEELEGRVDGYFVRAAALKPTQSGGRVLEGTGFT
ncbi:MAG: hypothetical protein K6U03_12510, partial [Firmicutes bacterium]|nr:hypothetical protein [Bacillota bacterium]